MTDRHMDWKPEDVLPLALDRIDERLHRYRLVQPQLERKMAQSLERYGQVSPIVVCVHEGDFVLIDGFKRLHAARSMKGMSQLRARRMDVDEQGAKAAIYNLNRVGQRPLELEESWIVQALVREDGLTQVEAARLLGRHKSWVNRRLAMLERLCEAARAELRLGLLSPAIALKSPSSSSAGRDRHRKSSRATSASSVPAAENSAAQSTLAIIWPIVFLAAATSTTSTC